MKKQLAILVTLCLGFTVGRAQDAAGDLGPGRELRVLFAGHSGGEREQAFLAFLRPWFAAVDAIPLEELDATAAKPYDVVVADWRRQYSADGGFDDSRSVPNRLGSDFEKPIIMIASVGGRLPVESKITWL